MKKKPNSLSRRPDPSQFIENKAAKRFFDSIDVERLHFFMQEPQYQDPDTGESRYMDYLRSFGDPAFDKLGDWGRLYKFRVTLAELHQIYLDGQKHIGLLKLADRLPTVIDNVAEDAESKLVNCPRCDGEKKVDSQQGDLKIKKRCPECEGVGKVKVSGDKHARDLVFESAKLIKQGGGPLVAIQQNIQQGDGSKLDSSLEDLMKLTQSITIGAKEVKNEAK